MTLISGGFAALLFEGVNNPYHDGSIYGLLIPAFCMFSLLFSLACAVRTFLQIREYLDD